MSILSLVLVILPALVFAGCDGEESDEKVKIVAHRGAMTDRPENTMASFERAVELGADILEIDLYTSRDGHLFVLHDSTLERTTDGEGQATDLTLQELQQLDAGSWFDPVYSNQTIPSVREVMNRARELETVLLLDLKGFGREYVLNVTNEVQAAGMHENVVVGVRSPEQAIEFRKLLPDSRLLAFMRSPDEIEEYAEAGVDLIRLWLQWLDEDLSLADKVRNTNTKLMINGTTGELEEAEKLMSYEPDWILIDNIAQLKESLEIIASEP